MCVNMIAASHNDLVLAAIGITIKVERLPNAINVGICQGMLPIVAFNYSSGDHERMKKVISTGRAAGLTVALSCMLLFQIFAKPFSGIFLSTASEHAETALMTLAYAELFLRIRSVASPVQFMNYHASYCMQAMGNGRGTLLHAFIRELVIYIPLMFLLDKVFGETGLAAALPVGEALSAVISFYLLHKTVQKAHLKKPKAVA